MKNFISSSRAITTLLLLVIVFALFNLNFGVTAAPNDVRGEGQPGFISKWVISAVVSPPAVSGVTLTEPNYCQAPGGVISWTFNPDVSVPVPTITWTGTTSGSQDMSINPNIQFATVGTYNFTVNTSMTIKMTGVAGGGGGGAGYYASPDGGGGGGGGASCTVGFTQMLIPGTTYQMSVGGGGAGGNADVSNSPTNGANGGATVFRIQSGTVYVSLNGGEGGKNGRDTSGGTGGSATGCGTLGGNGGNGRSSGVNGGCQGDSGDGSPAGGNGGGACNGSSGAGNGGGGGGGNANGVGSALNGHQGVAQINFVSAP